MLLAAAAVAAPAPAEAAPRPASRNSGWSQCRDVERPAAGEDWVYARCAGVSGIPLWYVCSDSARCRYGFGAKANVSGLFGTGPRKASPIEWRGIVQRGRFRPFAAIIRTTSPLPETKASRLTVYRLRPDGRSCIVGEAATNAAARRIADRARTGYRCRVEPETP